LRRPGQLHEFSNPAHFHGAMDTRNNKYLPTYIIHNNIILCYIDKTCVSRRSRWTTDDNCEHVCVLSVSLSVGRTKTTATRRMPPIIIMRAAWRDFITTTVTTAAANLPSLSTFIVAGSRVNE